MEIKTLPKEVLGILELFKGARYEIYVVGGAVRDLALGKQVYDWDFTTNATPEQILEVFPNGHYTNKFGTVVVPVEDSDLEPFEITTFRTEQGYSDSRRPDKVTWGKTLEDDLVRRDFTINAMAIELANSDDNKSVLKLIDLYGGQKDLKSKLIRSVGDPHARFSEDALRLMRAVRIAAELGFTIEENTFLAIKSNASLIQKIAKERVRDELLRILASNNPYEGVMLLKDTGLLLEILPEMEKAFGVEQKSPGRHHIYDVGTHCTNALREVAKRTADPITRFATLIHDIGKPQTFKKLDSGTITFYNHEVVGARIAKNIADRLKLSNSDRDKLWRLVRYHQFTVNEDQTDAAIRRFITKVTPGLVNDMIDLRVGDRLGGGSTETSWRLEEFKKRIVEVQKQPFSVTDLKINGRDVMETLNIKPGPEVGKILSAIFKEVADQKLENEREVLLTKIKSLG